MPFKCICIIEINAHHSSSSIIIDTKSWHFNPYFNTRTPKIPSSMIFITIPTNAKFPLKLKNSRSRRKPSASPYVHANNKPRRAFDDISLLRNIAYLDHRFSTN